MNYRRIPLLVLLLTSFINISAMAPGTVIDPLHYSGQFTVSAAPAVLNPGSAALTIPALSTLTQAGNGIYKNKGIPVIISLTASNTVWWALTTGTGFLLISQGNISNPAFSQAVASGASYALGQKAHERLKAFLNNPIVYHASQAGLIAGCLCLSYIPGSALLQSAGIAAAQAIGTQALVDASKQVLYSPPSTALVPANHNQTPRPAQYNFLQELKESAIMGTLDALQVLQISSLASMLSTLNGTELLKILLFEQAYRLAQSGCKNAEQLIKHRVAAPQE